VAVCFHLFIVPGIPVATDSETGGASMRPPVKIQKRRKILCIAKDVKKGTLKYCKNRYTIRQPLQRAAFFLKLQGGGLRRHLL
jgi:hypothetical protein